VAEAKLNIFVLKSHSKHQLITIKKQKQTCCKSQKRGTFAKNTAKQGTSAKSKHLTKITVSVISVFT